MSFAARASDIIAEAFEWVDRVPISTPYLLILPVLIWLVLFLIMPLLFIFIFGFFTYQDFAVEYSLTLDNYALVFRPAIISTFITTLSIGVAVTALTIVFGYPLAYWLNFKLSLKTGFFIVLLLIVPFWISPVILSIAWFPVQGTSGLINFTLFNLGIIDEPFNILFTRVGLGMAYLQYYVVFMAAPIYVAMIRIDDELLAASASLRGNHWDTFLHVTLPLSLPGVVVGAIFVFLLAMGNLLIPQLLGGVMTTTSLAIYSRAQIVNWPGASALSFWYIVASVLAIYLLVKVVDILTLFEG